MCEVFFFMHSIEELRSRVNTDSIVLHYNTHVSEVGSVSMIASAKGKNVKSSYVSQKDHKEYRA